MHDRPLDIVCRGLVVALIDVVWDTGFEEPLAEVLGKGLPVGMWLLAAAEEELEFEAELEGLVIHYVQGFLLEYLRQVMHQETVQKVWERSEVTAPQHVNRTHSLRDEARFDTQ